MTPEKPHRCGYITLVGKPNVGKSTLLNRLLGEKIAITSPRPQTTRNRIPGVLTKPDAQLVFIDTPGLHTADRALNQYMNDVATEAMWETDAVCLIIEAGTGPDLEVKISEQIAAVLGELAARERPVILAINKIDRGDREHLLPVMATYGAAFNFAAVVPISAQTGAGIEALTAEFIKLLPEGPALYPEDALTDLPERFIAAETIREKLFRKLGQEVPYATAVTIERWQDRTRDGMVEIDAIIHVERDSQKGIVIGKGGQMIKDLGILARKDLERLLAVQVHLRLFVRVEPAWTRSAEQLRKLGYT